MTATKSERDIEQQCRRYAESEGCMFWKFTSPGRPGVMDRILIVPSQRRICMRPAIAFIEMKRPGRKPTKLQQHIINKLSFAGVRATWFDNFYDFKDYLDGLIDA